MHHLFTSTVLAVAASCAVAQVVVSRLPEEIADVRWNVSSTVFGDFTCRGQKDMAMYGTSDKSGFVVMIKPAPRESKPTYLIFATRGRDSKNMKLEIESLDFARDEVFKSEIEAAAPGLLPSKTCKGISLGDSETDSHHIFWNRGKKAFQPWSR